MRVVSTLTGLALAISSVKAARPAAGEVEIDAYFVPEDCAKKSVSGSYLSMHYTGIIHPDSETGEPGKKFDSSRDRGDDEYFDFQVGSGQVIAGWDEGLLDMCVGEKRKLSISPEKGYGASGAGEAIPGGASLEFDVELIAISDTAPAGPNFFLKIDTDKDLKITREELAVYFKNAQGSEPEEAFLDQVMDTEDKDNDGSITWAEFGGPKGDAEPVHDEL